MEFRLPVEAVSETFSPFGLVDRLIKLIYEQLNSLPALPSKQEVLLAVGKAYDQYVAPIDLPGVPNFLEPFVDAQLRSMLLSIVDKLYDSLVAKRMREAAL